jgi:hypothetical protein
MFPVYFKDKNFSEPTDPIYYLITADGIFLVKKTILFSSITKVEGISGFKKQKPRLKLRLPKKIPLELFQKIQAFFFKIYQKHKTEAVILIYYLPKSQEYQVVVPKQQVGLSNCLYKIEPTPPDWLRFGTIHSHADMHAFHSGIDDQDESHDDGIHITIGNLDTVPTYSSSAVIDGQRFEVKLQDLIELPDSLTVPEKWLRRVKVSRLPAITLPPFNGLGDQKLDHSYSPERMGRRAGHDPNQ